MFYTHLQVSVTVLYTHLQVSVTVFYTHTDTHAYTRTEIHARVCASVIRTHTRTLVCDDHTPAPLSPRPPPYC